MAQFFTRFVVSSEDQPLTHLAVKIAPWPPMTDNGGKDGKRVGKITPCPEQKFIYVYINVHNMCIYIYISMRICVYIYILCICEYVYMRIRLGTTLLLGFAAGPPKQF